MAAVAYDLFRLPFVFAREWGIAGVIPALNLFKVFPAFGAMLLGQPIQQVHYSLAAHYLGWAYHFSNGLTIGVMYLALIGAGARRHWSWAVLLAMGLEAGNAVHALSARVRDSGDPPVCGGHARRARGVWRLPRFMRQDVVPEIPRIRPRERTSIHHHLY